MACCSRGVMINFWLNRISSFGFIVDEIEYDGTRWSLRGAAPSGGLAFAVPGAQAHGGAGSGVVTEAPILLGTGCRVRL